MSLSPAVLEGKVAVVTGAGRMRCIGRGIALEKDVYDLDAVQDLSDRLIGQGQGGAIINMSSLVGNMIAQLCSDQRSWISGHLCSVDGRQLAGR